MDLVYLGVATAMGLATYGLMKLCEALARGKSEERP
jgi:hypothetical protein